MDSLTLAFYAEEKGVVSVPDPAASKMESELFEQIGRLKMENEWLKIICWP